MRTILLFGPQGSGKGTQGAKLSEYLTLPWIVTGNIFRSHMKENTSLGQLAKQYINEGKLVPDEVTNRMITERLHQADCKAGLILDGYPRNLSQAQALDQVTKVTHLLHINLSDTEAMRRITNRRTCVEHGHVYHLIYHPPQQLGSCDIDGSELQQREDDTEAALQKRLVIYHQETEPLLEHYRPVVYTINGEQSIENVWRDIKTIF